MLGPLGTQKLTQYTHTHRCTYECTQIYTQAQNTLRAKVLCYTHRRSEFQGSEHTGYARPSSMQLRPSTEVTPSQRSNHTSAPREGLVLGHLESTLTPFCAPYISVFMTFPKTRYSKSCVRNSPSSYPGHTLTDDICQAGFPSLNAWFSPGESHCLPQAGHQPAERCLPFSGNGRQPHSLKTSVNASQHLSSSPLTSLNVFSFSSFSSGVYGGQCQSMLPKSRILAGAYRRSRQSSAPRNTAVLGLHPRDSGCAPVGKFLLPTCCFLSRKQV